MWDFAGLIHAKFTHVQGLVQLSNVNQTHRLRLSSSSFGDFTNHHNRSNIDEGLTECAVSSALYFCLYLLRACRLDIYDNQVRQVGFPNYDLSLDGRQRSGDTDGLTTDVGAELIIHLIELPSSVCESEEW